MNIEDFVEYKEMMLIAKKHGDKEEFNKYYKLLAEAYKEITGDDLEQVLQKMMTAEKERENKKEANGIELEM